MASTGQNFEIRTGDDLDLDFTATDSDTGNALDITSATLRWRMADSPYSSVRISKSSTAGSSEVAIVDSTAGQYTVKLRVGDLSGLSGVFYHEAEIVDSEGVDIISTIGHVTVRRSLGNSAG